VGIAWIENPTKGNALSSKVLGDLIEVLRERLDLFGHLLPKVERLPVPVLATVRRAAFRGSFELALACGMIIASEKASFCIPEPALGGRPLGL
jgi:enoyl-CoA hydratase/carnithine racemase